MDGQETRIDKMIKRLTERCKRRGKLPRINFWKRLAKEVKNKHNPNFWFCFAPFDAESRKNVIINKFSLMKKNISFQGTQGLIPEFPHVRLTEREIHCLFLSLQKLTYQQIAKRLRISHRTVEFYLYNIKNKCGIKKTKSLLENINAETFLLAVSHWQKEQGVDEK